MQSHTLEKIRANYVNWWDGHSRQTGQIHNRFLELRLVGLHQLAETIASQVKSNKPSNPEPSRPLMTLDDLNEFAIGSVVKCIGQEYAIYAGRRNLRIPNNDLLLMSRIMTIRGTKGEFGQVSSIDAEYDVPADAWYFDQELSGRLPYSICMEIALQPCGVLSAYLGTPLRFPEVDYYFRNLDGEAVFHRLLDARGKTIHTHAELLKTIYFGSTIIQHFSFNLSCEGAIFFEGNSSFGYFSPEAMAGQAGLDGGKTVLPWLQQTGQEKLVVPIQGTAFETFLPKGKLRLIDSAVIMDGAGVHHEGYAFASRRNSPQDWFYACHFHEDPVMAGSLGIEAIIQVMKIFARQHSKSSGVADFVVGQKMNWSYRGQVLQHNQEVKIEVNFHKPQRVGKKEWFIGDASLWADDSRIYEIRNMVIAVGDE